MHFGSDIVIQQILLDRLWMILKEAPRCVTSALRVVRLVGGCVFVHACLRDLKLEKFRPADRQPLLMLQ